MKYIKLFEDYIYEANSAGLKTLTKIANKHKCNKGTDNAESCGFTEHYNDQFYSMREDIKDMLEIGVDNGRSLKMWEEFFPNANIVGLDIEDKKKYDTERCKTYILDQSKRGELKKFADENVEKFDFIIDDGSHHMLDQQISFYHLFSKCLKPGGIFVIEDLHTSTVRDGRELYGKPVEIHEDSSNTTLYFLENRPFKSHYLEESECTELEESVGDIKVIRIKNPKSKWGPHSITSVIKKKEK